MDIQKERPSAPLIAIGALVTLTFGASFLPASWFGIQSAKKEYRRVDLSALSLDKVARDADADGDISWKELVTDSLSPSDIADIQKERPDPKVIADLNDPNNLTASFSKNLYSASAYLSKNQLNDPVAEQDVLNQLIAQEAIKMVSKKYTLSDISVAKTESKESIRTYGNTVAAILDGMITEKTIAEDISSVQAYIETKDESALKAIKKDYLRMEALLAKLLAMPVPVSAPAYHIPMLDKVGIYKDMLYNLSMVKDDPIRSMVSIQKYPDTLVSTLRVYEQLSAYFDIKNIVFTSKEAGYLFTAGYNLK